MNLKVDHLIDALANEGIEVVKVVLDYSPDHKRTSATDGAVVTITVKGTDALETACDYVQSMLECLLDDDIYTEDYHVGMNDVVTVNGNAAYEFAVETFEYQ